MYMKFNSKISLSHILMCALVLTAILALVLTILKTTQDGYSLCGVSTSSDSSARSADDQLFSVDTILDSYLFENYSALTNEEYQQTYEYTLAAPEYLPMRYVLYEKVFVQRSPTDPDVIHVKRLWYDANNLDTLIVMQMLPGVPCSGDGEFNFFNFDECGRPMYESFPWATYGSSYKMTDDELGSMEGYMLVNDPALKKECKDILQSMKIN